MNKVGIHHEDFIKVNIFKVQETGEIVMEINALVWLYYCDILIIDILVHVYFLTD